MATFYAARSEIITPLPWPTFALPFSRGDKHLRTLLVHGARAVVRVAAGRCDPFSRWVNALRERRGVNRTIVAVANKNARIIWAMLRRDSEFQPVV